MRQMWYTMWMFLRISIDLIMYLKSSVSLEILPNPDDVVAFYAQNKKIILSVLCNFKKLLLLISIP